MSEPSPGPSAGNRGTAQVVQPSRVQRTLARRAAQSRATIPAFESTIEIGVSGTLGRGSLTALLLEACAYALRQVPKANGSYRDGHFELYERVNIGLVIPTAEAVAIPTVFDADRSSVEELTDEARRLAQRAHAGTLTPPELAGTTFTLFDAAEHEVASVSPLIVPPHAAALASGAPRESSSGRTITATLATDHRILYGLEAFRFLTAIKDRLEAH
jgi:pyruvate dehydrogenase E2 component (dihydrolipoamide acetyltransferase)